MGNEAILVLQGGGALGAYECGVYKALVPYIERHGHSLSLVAGTSIGALNASVIATRYNTDKDRGVRALEDLWTRRLATPSAPFLPDVCAFQSYNAIWTNLLFGNLRLYSPRFFGWPLFAPVFWGSFTYFYDVEPMRKTLAEIFAPISAHNKGEAPRLIVTAVDIESGSPKVFDSEDDAINPEDVLASCALPPWLPEKAHDGRHYWDGGLQSNTPLRDALNALQRQAPDRVAEEYDVYIVAIFPRKGRIPTNNWEVWSRAAQITYGDKSEFDETVSNMMNRYLDFVKRTHEASRGAPTSPLRDMIEEEYEKLRDNKRVKLNIKRIQRDALDGELTSREIDFSPKRICALIQQGYDDARRELHAQDTKK
jgi:NTE family protein